MFWLAVNMATQQQILHILKTRSAYDITEQLLDFQPILKLVAEQGGLRSYIIYMLYRDGKTNFWKIVDETGFSKSHTYCILRSLKNEGVIENDAGDWSLKNNTTQHSAVL